MNVVRRTRQTICQFATFNFSDQRKNDDQTNSERSHRSKRSSNPALCAKVRSQGLAPRNRPRNRIVLEHRRGWIRDRLEFRASAFAVDCLTFFVMSSHVQLVLRSRLALYSAIGTPLDFALLTKTCTSKRWHGDCYRSQQQKATYKERKRPPTPELETSCIRIMLRPRGSQRFVLLATHY